MALDNPRAKALLEKLHAGKCTPEELAILDQWYATLEEDNPIQLSAQQASQYREQFLHTFRNNRQQQRTRQISKSPRWLVAACLLLLAGLGYRWLLSQQKQAPATANVHKVNNNTAHVKKIVLADSSVVWLNAHASLSWKEEDHQRRVTLNGEGYFEVRSNAQQPFIIDTRDLQIRVLGTTFNVEAYQAEKMTRVALVNGSVQLRAIADSNRQTLLQPGQLAVLNGSDSFTIRSATTAAISSWTNGGFVVNNIPVKDAVARLCERNAYTLQWKNTKDIYKTVSVSFMGETFEQSLGNLCYLIHKQYKLKGNQVTIY
jgi:ferric-dicitrate binding protein FerR (iron transport regulator)